MLFLRDVSALVAEKLMHLLYEKGVQPQRYRVAIRRDIPRDRRSILIEE